MRRGLALNSMRIGWRGRGFRTGFARGQRRQDRRIDAEHGAERAQDFCRLGGGTQEFGRLWAGKQDLEATRVAGGLVRDSADQPGAAARQGGGAGPRCAGAGGAGAGFRQGVGLEMGNEASETLLHAGEIPGQRHHEMVETGVAVQAVGDEIFEAADHRAEARGKARSGRREGVEVRCDHEKHPILGMFSVQLIF